MFRTLRSQYLLASLLVFAAMLGLLLWNAQHLMQQVLDERFDDEQQAYAPLLVAAYGPLLAARDYATISELVEANMRSRNLAFIELRDRRGSLVAHAGDAAAPQQRVAEVPVLVAGQSLGKLRFGIRTAAVVRAHERLLRNSVAIGASVLFVGMLLLAAGMAWLNRGFNAMLQASRRVAQGDYATRLAPSRVQELDALADAFNHMARAIESKLGELRDSEQFLRGVLDTLSEGFMIVDRDNRVLECNETFLRLHGAPRLAGAAFDAAAFGTHTYRPDGVELPAPERATVAVLATGLPQRDRLLRIERADGSSSWVSVNATPLRRNEAEAPYAALATLTDVSRHIEAEQQLRSANEGLEQRVRDRTRELERAKNEAERANLAKSEFLSRMSHELRTPLNAILGFAQLLALDPRRFEPAQREQLRQIESAGWHLLALINDVLDLSRIESGALTTSNEPVELGTLVDEVLPLVQPMAATHRVTLLPPVAVAGGAWVLADRKRLKQVLSNLLSNAIKYNAVGGQVSVLLPPPHDGRQAFEVHDTGRGFEPEQLRQLYQPFTRFVQQGEAIEGTGIGLVITRRLVDLMGGRLELESQPGVGSVFRVELRAITPPLAASPAPATTPPAPPATTTSCRLLYVEDNPSNVILMRQVVALRPSWSLAVAGDGLEGLARLREERFDGAIVDIDLPGIDGIELCRRLRADPATRSLPLMALSANAMPADIRHARAAGFDDYLTKPIDVSSLLVRIDGLLAGPHSDGGGAP